MATRNVVLSQHQHEFVESLVQSGRYQNASEVLREGLRILERREEGAAAKLMALRRAAEQGWSDVESGRFDDIDDRDLDDFIGELGLRATHAKRSG
ncbi:type II toxin-antitoxin system ParD family antitoxin [Arthrobacter sp. JSM 101049]|uniref:type II toxin-antitoxin system ParD family antitoxin n=1 Tax=Arthrobacter sp. JSM 101049 TaxID=929097 RepID=UPI0035657FD7